MGLTYDEAYKATNPADPDDARHRSALAIIAGTAANEAYWNSRTELEALQARADGHGVVVRGSDEEGGSPTVVGTSTGTEQTIEGTAVDEPAGLATGATVAKPPDSPPPPDNSTEAVAALRKQLTDAGLTPQA